MTEPNEDLGETASENFREDANEANEGGGANETRWITTGQAAKILGASVSTVRRLVDDGDLVGERKETWAGRQVDALGRRLNGHRRVSEASVKHLQAVRAGQAASPSESASPATLDS